MSMYDADFDTRWNRTNGSLMIQFMIRKRGFLITCWIILTILGGILFQHNIGGEWIWLFMGFHVPVSSHILFVVAAVFYTEQMTLAMIHITINLLFGILVLVSLIRVRRSKMFEYLVILDPIIALFEFILHAIILFDDFAGWWYIVALTIDSAIRILIYGIYRKKRRQLKAEHC